MTSESPDNLTREEALKRITELQAELEGHEGLLRLAMDDMRKMYGDLLQAQAQMMQADKLSAVGLMAASIIHDINNPLSTVQGAFSVLEESLQDIVPYLKAVEDLKKSLKPEDRARLQTKGDIAFFAKNAEDMVRLGAKSVVVINKIVASLKTFSRADRGTMTSENLNKVLEGVAEIAWCQIRTKAELVKKYGEIPEILCNAQQLGQVFMNLLVNAAQAIPTRGTITVETRAEKGNIVVRISDTGQGIPPEIMQKIFEPFFTTKEPGKGTGLGLSITRDIIEKHKGTIQVESTVGKGTAFTMRFPTLS